MDRTGQEIPINWNKLREGPLKQELEVLAYEEMLSGWGLVTLENSGLQEDLWRILSTKLWHDPIES